jgi:cytochrome c5
MRNLALILMLGVLSGCGGGAEDTGTAQSKAPGELTYQRYCFSCHASGVSGAPPIGNSAAWAPRIAQGEDVLLEHTIAGMPSTGMPPRGMCLQCTDQELLDAIRYMAAARP